MIWEMEGITIRIKREELEEQHLKYKEDLNVKYNNVENHMGVKGH